MAKRLRNRKDYRTTDHAAEISLMEDFVTEGMNKYPDANAMPKRYFLEVTICKAAAELLQCHDDTGISLDNWDGPRCLVETGLMIVGLDRDMNFLENGV